MTEHEKNSKQSRITEQSDTQIALSEYNKLRNHDNETGLTGTGVTYSFFPHTNLSPRKNEYILSFPPGKMSIY